MTTVGAGYDNYPIDEFEKQGVRFTNSSGIHGQAMGEHVFGMAFSFSRRLMTYRDLQRSRSWDRSLEHTDFAGDVCCIVGLGSIGEALARRARAFEMTVRGVKRDPSSHEGNAHEVYSNDGLIDALTGARLVVLSVPLKHDTVGMIGAEEISVCKDDAVIVNIARGPVLDTSALLAALDAGSLGGAGIDVFDTEPLPEGSPLWGRDDVVLTPHRAGASDKYTARFFEVFREQYERWRRGGELKRQVA